MRVIPVLLHVRLRIQLWALMRRKAHAFRAKIPYRPISLANSTLFPVKNQECEVTPNMNLPSSDVHPFCKTQSGGPMATDRSPQTAKRPPLPALDKAASSSRRFRFHPVRVGKAGRKHAAAFRLRDAAERKRPLSSPLREKRPPPRSSDCGRAARWYYRFGRRQSVRRSTLEVKET